MLRMYTNKQLKDNPPYYLLPLLAETAEALKKMREELAAYLDTSPEVDFINVVNPLHINCKELSNRQVIICKNKSDAIRILRLPDTEFSDNSYEYHIPTITKTPSIVFLCSGAGEHYTNMGKDLYNTEPFFRKQIDKCSEILKHYLIKDLREIMFSATEDKDKRDENSVKNLNSTEYLLSAVFTIGYASAMLWIKYGVNPTGLIGHSTGEYLAACLAGVISLKDALYLLVKRAQIINKLPKGSMLAIPMKEQELCQYLDKDISLGVINGPSRCVLSGDTTEIGKLAKKLLEQDIETKYLPVTHAFHSHMMKTAKNELLELFNSIKYNEPNIPYISNLTGKKITPAEATNPEYWYRHTCETVRFSEGVKEVLSNDSIFLEVGPGRNLANTILQHQTKEIKLRGKVLNTIRNFNQVNNDYEYLLNTIGKLWIQGVEINWSALYAPTDCL